MRNTATLSRYEMKNWEKTLRGRRIQEKIIGERANLRGKARHVIGERRSGVLVVIRCQKIPGNRHQTLSWCHFLFLFPFYFFLNFFPCVQWRVSYRRFQFNWWYRWPISSRRASNQPLISHVKFSNAWSRETATEKETRECDWRLFQFEGKLGN